MVNPLRILHVGKFYPPHMGGMETHLEALCNELHRWADVRVLVANNSGNDAEENIRGVPVTRVRTSFSLASAPICPGLVRRLGRTDADVVHIHLPNPGAVLAYLRSGHQGPLVVTYHSDSVRQRLLGMLFEPILHRFLQRAKAIIVTSPNYLRTSPVLQHHLDRCHVVPLGIHLQPFAKCDSEIVREVREKFGNRLVIAVGRLVYYKGFDYLIEAMSGVDGRLLIIGEGPLRVELECLAANRGLRDKVVFLGRVTDAAPYYHACDVFVLPSVARSEAFGIVQLEAMAAGRPVINTQLDSGVPFVSLNGVSGLTVPPAHARSLTFGINLLLDDPILRSRYGAAARARVQNLFSLEAMASRTLQIYREVLEARKPATAAPRASRRARPRATGGVASL